MERTIKHILFSLVLCLFITLGLTMQDVQPVQAKRSKKSSVKISVRVKAPYSKNMKLRVGQTARLKVSVKATPNKKAYQKVTYQSSKKKVVTVNKKGVVKAKKEGKAKITVCSTKNKRKKAVVKVKVEKNATGTPAANENQTAPVTPAPPTTTAKPADGSIQNAEALHPRVIRVTLDQPVELKESDIVLKKVKTENAIQKKTINVYDIQKENSQSYLVYILEQDALKKYDYLEVSIGKLPGVVKDFTLRYQGKAKTYYSESSISRKVGEEFVDYDLSVFPHDRETMGYVKIVKVEGLPEGLTITQSEMPGFYKVNGTCDRVGIFDVEVTLEDEADNIHIHNCRFAFYDENSIQIITRDFQIYKMYKDLSADVQSFIHVRGGSGNYIYEVAENPYGAEIGEKNGDLSVWFDEPGTYPITITATDQENPELKTTKTIYIHVEKPMDVQGKIVNAQGKSLSNVEVTFYAHNGDPVFEYKETENGSITTQTWEQYDNVYDICVPLGMYDVLVEDKETKECVYLQNVNINSENFVMKDIVLG